MAPYSRSTSRRHALKLTGGSFAALGTSGLVGPALASTHGRTIVGLTADADFDVAASQATSVHRRLDFGHVGKAVAGAFPQRAIRTLQDRPHVRYVENDGRMYALGDNRSWSVDRIDADVVHANGETGHGVDIAVVDTGIDSDHPALGDSLGEGKAFVECKGSPRNCRFPWDDDNGHGTLCTGIVDAVNGPGRDETDAPTFHAVKALDKRGAGSFSDVAAGIEWLVDRGYEVANLSLGSSTPSRTVRDAGRYASEAGVLLVAAVGNDGPCSDCVRYPAAFPEFLAVSATACDDGLADFSSTGPEVDIAAPGEAIHSTIPGGYETVSGTSMAAPHVAGAGSVLMADGSTNEEARERLVETAENVGLTESEEGAGLVDVAAALGYDSSDDRSGDGTDC